MQQRGKKKKGKKNTFARTFIVIVESGIFEDDHESRHVLVFLHGMHGISISTKKEKRKKKLQLMLAI